VGDGSQPRTAVLRTCTCAFRHGWVSGVSQGWV
jgi:hypothetical protein